MTDEKPQSPVSERPPRGGQAAIAFVIGLAALSAQASEHDAVRDIQRYCTACWRNAHIDPGVWDDCTQEVCCRLIERARAGELDLAQVLEDDSPERRELVRAIDMVRKRVQRARRPLSLDAVHGDYAVCDEQFAGRRRELGEILERARQDVLTPRQDRILDYWMDGWTVPEIAREMGMPPARVSDEKYKSLRKLERHLAGREDDLVPVPGGPSAA